MKPKNFPARKFLRKIKAMKKDPNDPYWQSKLEEARNIRTKKRRD